jgi:alpha-L-rhamnosidase
MSDKFIKALPIYPKKYIHEMNMTFFFVREIGISYSGVLRITGNSIYRVFDNGKMIGYGPARAAHDYYRIDEYVLSKTGHHRIVIELVGYNCNSYYCLNTDPFLQAEVEENNEIVAYTGDDKFMCFRNLSRIQKVVRFSFQRTFSESYRLVESPELFLLQDREVYPPVDYNILTSKKYLPRNVAYPAFNNEKFILKETGIFTSDLNKRKYHDRYMDLEFLKIFPVDQWEVNPNDFISSLCFKKEDIKCLETGTFFTYQLENSKTGFLDFELDCQQECDIYFVFDEINQNPNGDLIDISFFRNTTHNIISYHLCPGHYHHVSMEPYTMKYLRLIVGKGKVSVKDINIIKYENTSIKANLAFSDENITTISKAAIATFAQNAVDILTDCPSRERAGWLFDSFFTSMTENILTGNNQVERNFLENYALLKQYPSLPQGMIPMCYPGEFPDGVFIPNWSLFYILELAKYLQYTGDEELIKASLDNVEHLLEYFQKFENELGLLENLQGWIFVEWSGANDDNFVSGVNFPSNMLYASALEAASLLLKRPSLLLKARAIKEAINKYSFDGQFYQDNLLRNNNNQLVKTGHISETCQYYAFYFQVATIKSRPQLFTLLLEKFGPKRDDKRVYPQVYKSNVLIGDYLRLFILLDYAFLSEVEEETLDYFYQMAKNTGTIWEHDSPAASLNHGLTSCLLNILLEAYLGVKEINHHGHYLVMRQKVLPKDASYQIDTPYGPIEIQNNCGKISIKKPDIYQIIYE